MRTAVYEYGLLQPTSGEQEASDQIWLAHQYYNKLIEIEREKREKVFAVQADDPVLGPLAEAYKKAHETVEQLQTQKKRAKSHDGKTQPPPKGAITEAKTARTEARKALAEAKKERAEVLLPLYKQLDEETHKKRLAARAECNVFWGTYLQIEQAVAQACKSPKSKDGKRPNKRKSHLPQFRRWTGDGLVAVQIQKGLPADEVFGTDSRVQVNPIDDAPQAHLDRVATVHAPPAPRGRRHQVGQGHPATVGPAVEVPLGRSVHRSDARACAVAW
jgi:hypothetical protein